MSRSLIRRVVTGVVGVPVLVFFLYFGGWPLLAMLFLVAVTGMYEFYKAVSDGKNLYAYSAGCACAAFYYIFLVFMEHVNAVTIVVILLPLVLGFLNAVFHKRIHFKNTAMALFGFCYIALPLSVIYFIWQIGGGWLAAVVFFSAWGCDTGAYVVGKAMGKRKLAPDLSPGKTVEGAVGGTVTAGLLTAGMVAVVSAVNDELSLAAVLLFALVGVVCAVFAQAGDLFASAVKRHAGIKDFGRILPGHGGVIDRFDSILFAAPVLYLLTITILKGFYG